MFKNGVVIHVNTVGVLELNACLCIRGDHLIIANRVLHVKLTYPSDVVGEDVLKIYKRKLRVSSYNNLGRGSEVRLSR